MSGISKTVVERAQDGDAGALESLARGVQDQVHRLAMRMLADPHAAQDASQEILIRVITKLSTFAGDSKFETWVYRVAVNYLLSARKVIERDPNLSFAAFSEDLLNGLTDDHHAAPEDHVMLAELRVRCTMAMLLCLDRAHRAAYVLGEIFELDQTEAASILQVSASTYRKRLSRARKSVVDFTARTCGVANPSARCSCRKTSACGNANGPRRSCAVWPLQ